MNLHSETYHLVYSCIHCFYFGHCLSSLSLAVWAGKGGVPLLFWDYVGVLLIFAPPLLHLLLGTGRASNFLYVFWRLLGFYLCLLRHVFRFFLSFSICHSRYWFFLRFSGALYRFPAPLMALCCISWLSEWTFSGREPTFFIFRGGLMPAQPRYWYGFGVHTYCF